MLNAGDYICVTMTAAQKESDEPAVAIFWHFESLMLLLLWQ